MKVLLRNAGPEDRNFVLSSWLRSYRDAHYFDAFDNGGYYDFYQKHVKEVLNRPETRVLIAHFDTDPDEILGYVVGEPGDPAVIHYLYVKQPFRQRSTPRDAEPLGLADKLVHAIAPRFGQDMTVCTSTAPGWSQLRTRYRLCFCPYK